MRVLIYTANMGGRDVVRAPLVDQSIPVDYLHITDGYADAPAPWHTERVPILIQHPNLRAKWYKTHPPLAKGYDIAIWVDASMEITSPTFAVEAIDALDGTAIAVWEHPRRDCIYTEADASLGAEGGRRYELLPIRSQMRSYIDEGYPARNGLYACGTIVWTPTALAIGDAWYRECAKWGYQDQLSFPVVCWRAGMKPATFPVPQITVRRNGQRGMKAAARPPYLENAWLRIWPHQPGTDGGNAA